MTHEEAIKELNTIYLATEIQRVSVVKEDVQEALKIANECIEKQIPKKPIISEREVRYCEVWECPSCGFEWSSRVVDYCYKCGQRIDWSEVR